MESRQYLYNNNLDKIPTLLTIPLFNLLKDYQSLTPLYLGSDLVPRQPGVTTSRQENVLNLDVTDKKNNT